MVTALRQEAQKQSGLSGVSYGGSSQASPSQVSNAVSTSLGYTPNAVSTNPHDAPGYNPATDKTSSAYNPNAVANPIDTSQPSPAKVIATPTTGAVQNNTNPTNTAQELKPTDQVPQALADQVSQAGSAVDQLKQKYTKAFTDVTGSGVPAPSGQGSANAGLKAALDKQPKPAPEVPESVKSFMDPATNPILDEQTQKLREFLSPESDRVALNESIAQLRSDRATLSGLKVELMNVKNIMAGSQQDIADEVTKAGGTISASLLANMTIARNRTLIARGQQLTDQIQAAADIVASDVSLVGDEKQLAQQQFTQNMSLLQYQQTNRNNQLSAARESIKMLLGPNMENAQAVYNSVKGTAYEDRYEQVLGLPKGGMAQLASVANLDTQKKQLEIQKLQQDINGGGNISTQVVDVGGKKLLINSKTGETIKEITPTSGNTGAQLQLAQGKSNIDQIADLQKNIDTVNAVGPNWASKINLKSLFTGEKSNFIASVEQLREQLTLDKLVQAKAQGATFGALSDGERQTLSAAATKIGTYATKDSSGKVTGYNAGKGDFKKELDKISNFAKLDYVLQGGAPEDVGAQKMADGTIWSRNSDGTLTQIQ